LNDKILNFLGLCRRAGKLTVGNDAVVDEIKNNKAKLVIVSVDISSNTEKKLKKACEYSGVECLKLNRSRDELSAALGKFCVVIAVLDDGFAKKLVQLIKSENQEVTVYDKI
jgi:ribosomal protein L7Ae-like RNA K-turn-binding protein